MRSTISADNNAVISGGLDAEELAELRATVQASCESAWADPTAAASADISEVWDVAVSQGWTELHSEEFFSAALVVQEEMGRIACPLSITDLALVSALLETELPDVVAKISEGTIRPTVGYGSIDRSTAEARHVEAASAATHVLIIDETQQRFVWHPTEHAEITETPGLPIPAWSRVLVSGVPEHMGSLSGFPDFTLLRRLGLVARGLAALEDSHAAALEHAQTRQQFGKLIGSFQAVSHRLVNGAIALRAARDLLNNTLELRSQGDSTWRFAAEIFVSFMTERYANLQFDAHHTLAASGYFEESSVPWLFRRLHADMSLATSLPMTHSVASFLLEEGATLPSFGSSEAAQRIQQEVFDAFEPWVGGRPSHLSWWDDGARQVLREKNWIGVGWPEEFGGGGWPVADVIAFSEAIAYTNPPLGNIWMGINSIAPMVLKVGTPELRELVLEEVRKGDLSIALGYSEPEAGSDLASLRTKAEKVNGGWRINGQKMWGTSFPDSKWVVLAARTDPDAKPRHAGISLFLVDTDSPGITVTPHTSLAEDVSATTFWDNVFVPDDRLIGEVNQGWKALMTALASERVLIGASVMRVHRAFDRLVNIVKNDPEHILPARRDDYRREISRIAVRLQSARALVKSAVRATSQGGGTAVEGPMAKIVATELAEDLNATAIALLGPDALHAWGVDNAVGEGYFEDGLRASIMGVVAGGTGDIQRNLVARSIGLPK